MIRSWVGGLCAVTITTIAGVASAAPWEAGTPLPTARAQGVATVDLTGAIHVIGGYTSGGVIPDHSVLLGDGGWIAETPLPEGNRGGAAATGKDGTIYYVGGIGTADPNTAHAYGSDAGWSVLANPPFSPGWETSADIGADGKLYVFGGEGAEITDAGNLGNTNSKTQIFDPTTQTWSVGASMPARRKQHSVLRGSDGFFYVIGGEDQNEVPSNTVFIYHPATDTWTNGPDLAFPEPADAGDSGADAGDGGVPVLINSFAAAATADRSVFVIAGGSDAYPNDEAPYYDTVYLFDVGAQKWTQYASPLPVARRELMAAISGCTLSVLGGVNGTEFDENDTNTSLLDTICAANASGPKCVPDAVAHCGCESDTDCASSGRICSAAHICEAAPVGDGGESDGGSVIRDGGGLGGGDSGLASDGGSGDDNGATPSSSGCSCRSTISDSSSALGWGVGVLALLLARTRSRRRARK